MNKLQEELQKIEVPAQLHGRVQLGVAAAKEERQQKKRKAVRWVWLAAGLAAAVSVFSLYTISQQQLPPATQQMLTEPVRGVKIPKLQLPENTANADMLGLIFYKGNSYLQTDAEVEPARALELRGEKLGRAKGNLDEWSKQEEFTQEFASSSAPADVYAVKGYDSRYRIMTYDETTGKAELFECWNGMTIWTGADVFRQLRLDTAAQAQFRFGSDWDNAVESYHPVADIATVQQFVAALYSAAPQQRTEKLDPIADHRGERLRELTLSLPDGTKVRLMLLEGGYVYYRYMDVFFKVDEQAFQLLWDRLK